MKSTNPRQRILVALMLTGIFGLAACDLPQFQSQKDIAKKTDETSEKSASKMNAAAGIGVKPSDIDPLSVSNDMWLGNQAIHMHSGKPLPSKFESNKGFTLISATPIDLRTVAMEVSNSTGIKASVGDLTLPGASTTAAAPTTSSTSTTTSTDPTALPPLPSLVETSDKSINVSYTGPLSKFLDQVAEQLDVSWRYDGDSIYFYRYESKTFVIEALASKSSITDNFSPSSSSSSGSSGSSGSSSSSTSDVTQTNSLKNDSDSFKDIEAALKGMLGSDGSEVMVPSSGTVVVTARPSKLELIGKYLKEENARLTRQVAIDIVVYDVTVTNEDNYGIDLSNVFAFANTTAAGQVASATTQIGSTTVGITSPTNVIATNGAANSAGLSLAYLSSHWSGSLVAKALSSLGKTVEVTRAPIVTLNNRAASRKIATDQTYIASQSATAATSTSAATQSITPGTASTGITLQVLPRMTNDDQILLQYSIIISALNGAITQTCSSPTGSNPSVGSSCIGTPNTTNKVFVQQALLQNGATLVLAGFDKNSGNDSSEGIGSASNWLMGGVDAQNTHQQLVITITPREITPGRGDS